jgi:hypothetical protein
MEEPGGIPPKNRELSLIVTAGIIAAFAVVDFYAPFAMNRDSPWPRMLAIGVCIGQVTLISAWAVFAPGNIVVRLPWSLLLGLSMLYVMAFAERQTSGARSRAENILILGIVLLLGVTIIQVPLWIAKRAFRYRMLSPGELPVSSSRGPMQFQLKHLILGTFLLSVALSPIRLILPKESVGSLMPDRELLVLIPLAVVGNLVATVPCLWGGFESTRSMLRLGIAWCVYILVVTSVELPVALMPGDAPHKMEVFAMIYLINFAQGFVVFAVMRIYRTLGYRLQRVPRGG